MPRLHIWVICATALSAGTSFVYYRLYIPRVTSLQDEELALEAERFAVQRLHQRAVLLKSVKPRVNAEKLRLFADVQQLVQDTEKNQRVGRDDEETIRTILSRVQAVRCNALTFRDVPLRWWMRLQCAVAFSVHQTFFRVLFRLAEFVLSMIPFFGRVLFLPLACCRHYTARALLRMLKLDVSLIDVEKSTAKAMMEKEEAIHRQKGKPEDHDGGGTRSPLLSEGLAGTRAPFVFSPRCWIDEVAVHAALPPYAHVVFCGTDPIERINGIEEPPRLSVSFGYPLRPRVTHQHAMVRPLAIEGLEAALAIPVPPAVTKLDKRIKKEQFIDALLEGQTEGPYRSRHQSNLTMRMNKSEIIEDATKAALEESRSYAVQLWRNYSDEDRLHLFSHMPLPMSWCIVYGGDAPKGKKRHFEVTVKALERCEPQDVWATLLSSYSISEPQE